MAFSTFSSIGSLVKKGKTAPAAPPYTLTDIVTNTTGLVYFYKFETDDISNGKLFNYATGQNDLTLIGNPIQNNVFKYGSNSMRGSTVVNTPSNYAYITNCATFRNTGFTISFWFYTATSVAHTVQTFFISRSCSTNPMTNISQVNSSAQEFEIRGSWSGVGNPWLLNFFGNTAIRQNVTLPLINGTTLNNWYHVAVTVNSSANEYKTYINGTNDYTGTIPSMFGTSNVSIFSLMVDYSASIRRTNYANMDNLRIYNRVLTAGEIGTLYNET